MIQTVDRWRIDVRCEGQTQIFWINENSISNVLRWLASMQFSSNGLVHPESIAIVRDVIK